MKRLAARFRRAAGTRVAVIPAAIAIISGLCSAQPAATGGISGTISDPNGIGVEATVRVTRFGTPKTTVRSKSAANGAFSLTGLPAGTYSICATALNPGFADGCLWGYRDPVAVAAGQTTSGQSLQLETGALLQV